MAAAIRTAGIVLRECAQALDRAGCMLQGTESYKEVLSRHRPAMPVSGKQPKLPSSGFIAPSASVIGDVSLGEHTSVWYGAILRGDVNSIRVGSNTNLQDGVVVHVARESASGSPRPTVVGSNATVGHSAVLHACTLDDGAFVGMGATVLDGAHVHEGAIVAAGAVVTPNTEIPSGQIWAGNPAKFLRNVSEQEAEFIPKSADSYSTLAHKHAEETSKSWEQLVRDAEFRRAAAETSRDYADHIGVKHPLDVESPNDATTTPSR